MKSPSINSIPVEMKSTAYCYAINKGGEAEFDFLFKQLKEDRKENVKADLLVGLSCAPNAWQLEKLVNDRFQTSNDTMLVLRDIITKSSSYVFAWNFIKNNWDDLYSRYRKSIMSFIGSNYLWFNYNLYKFRYSKQNLDIVNYLYLKDILNDLSTKLNTDAFYNDVSFFNEIYILLIS
jgi:hypothetical protein